MNLVLNIDVSGKTGMVTLSQDGKHIDLSINENQMDHAAFLQPAIKRIMKKNGLTLQQLKAVAVSNGPGSYTGLRVGLAAAKGIAFALQIPLLTISTLELMATAAINYVHEIAPTAMQLHNNYFSGNEQKFVCPIIDARRMEVFFGLYNLQGDIIVAPCAAVIDERFLHAILYDSRILFTGSGSEKLKAIIDQKNTCFIEDFGKEFAFAELSDRLLKQNTVASLPWAEPYYCKEFYNSTIIEEKQKIL